MTVIATATATLAHQAFGFLKTENDQVIFFHRTQVFKSGFSPSDIVEGVEIECACLEVEKGLKVAHFIRVGEKLSSGLESISKKVSKKAKLAGKRKQFHKPAPVLRDAVAGQAYVGTISGWNEEKGYGFFEIGKGCKGVFVHISEMPKMAVPAKGQKYHFTASEGRKGIVATKCLSYRRHEVERSRDGTKILFNILLGGEHLVYEVDTVGVDNMAATEVLPIEATLQDGRRAIGNAVRPILTVASKTNLPPAPKAKTGKVAKNKAA